MSPENQLVPNRNIAAASAGNQRIYFSSFFCLKSRNYPCGILELIKTLAKLMIQITILKLQKPTAVSMAVQNTTCCVVLEAFFRVVLHTLW